MTYSDGAAYIGDFKFGQRHGYGVMEYANGGHYDGSWVHNFREGDGTYNFEDEVSACGRARACVCVRVLLCISSPVCLPIFPLLCRFETLLSSFTRFSRMVYFVVLYCLDLVCQQ